MMPMVLDAMDSPFEALPFDYLKFGLLPLVNNVWTWIAVITAAISFWRLKAVAVSPPDIVPRTAPSPPHAPLQDERAPEGGSEIHASEPTPAPSPVLDCLVAGTTKKQKFTLYYEEAEEAEEEEEAAKEAVAEEWWKRWEAALGTKRGEKGWYRYQHVGELNGNVVRLWDGHGGAGQWAS